MSEPHSPEIVPSEDAVPLSDWVEGERPTHLAYGPSVTDDRKDRPMSEPIPAPLANDLERAADTYSTRAMPVDPERALLDQVEFTRLVYLLALLNDASVTQLDTEECRDLSRLLYKISNDGDESGRER